jgi:hypothetical protein
MLHFDKAGKESLSLPDKVVPSIHDYVEDVLNCCFRIQIVLLDKCQSSNCMELMTMQK